MIENTQSFGMGDRKQAISLLVIWHHIKIYRFHVYIFILTINECILIGGRFIRIRIQFACVAGLDCWMYQHVSSCVCMCEAHTHMPPFQFSTSISFHRIGSIATHHYIPIANKPLCTLMVIVTRYVFAHVHHRQIQQKVYISSLEEVWVSNICNIQAKYPEMDGFGCCGCFWVFTTMPVSLQNFVTQIDHPAIAEPHSKWYLLWSCSFPSWISNTWRSPHPKVLYFFPVPFRSFSVFI